MNEKQFLEDLEDDFYGLWEIPEFFDETEKTDIGFVIDTVLRLIQDRGIRVFEALAGTRSNMVEVVGDAIPIMISEKEKWREPSSGEDRAIFLVRNPQI